MGLEDFFRRAKVAKSELAKAPEKVQRAYQEDPELHRRMSSAGGKQSAINRDNDRIYREAPGNVAPQQKAEEDFRREQSGEDLIEPNNID